MNDTHYWDTNGCHTCNNAISKCTKCSYNFGTKAVTCTECPNYYTLTNNLCEYCLNGKFFFLYYF